MAQRHWSTRPTRAVLAVFAAIAVLPAAAVPARADRDAGASSWDGPLPTISPTPQSVTTFSQGFSFDGEANLVAGSVPGSVVDAVTTSLRGAGVSRVHKDGSSDGPSVYIGQTGKDRDVDRILRQWKVPGPATARSGGYVLAVGTMDGAKTVVISGADAAGAFYATQTLRQLVLRDGDDAGLPGVIVRDFPAFALRGGMESFYGDPWAQGDLLRHLDFLGQHRMNAFQYTVSNDPRTSGRLWRSPYPPEELQKFTEAIARARTNFVEFIYRINPEANVAPEYGICHALRSDLDALVARYQQLWDIGERVFSIGWDDVHGRFACQLDQDVFGGDVSPLGAAQAHVVNHIYHNFITKNPGARLVTVPTEYAGTHTSPYRTRFAQLIPADVSIFWTGREVVSPTITAADLAAAQQAFGGRRLLIFDNYPVNDYAPQQQHLGPLVGRDAALAGAADGFLANEMQEAEASLISLYTVGEYAWNPSAYQPAESWTRSLREFGGAAYGALRDYAENSLFSPLHGEAAPRVWPLIAALRTAWRTGADVGPSSTALLTELARIRPAPATLRATMTNARFLRESEPWLVTMESRVAAAEAAVRALRAQAAGDLATYRAERRAMGQALLPGDATAKMVAPGVYDELFDLVTTSRGSTIVRHDNGAMSAFARGANGHLNTAWQSSAGSNWSAFTSLTGITMLGQPEVVVRRNGAMSAVVRGSDNRLWTNRQVSPGVGWEGWTRISDVEVAGDPTVVQADDGVLNAFARGANGQLHTFWQSGAGWRAAALPGITMLGKPAVVVAPNGAMSAFVRGMDNRVWTNWQETPGAGWRGWTSLGGAIADNPSVVTTHNGAFSVFARGTDGRMYTAYQDFEGDAFGPFTPLPVLVGIGITGQHEVTLSNTGALAMFVRGSDGRIWTSWQRFVGDGFSAWSGLRDEGVAAGSPRIIDSAIGAGSVFVLNGNGNMLTTWQPLPGHGWTPWANLGGSLTS